MYQVILIFPCNDVKTTHAYYETLGFVTKNIQEPNLSR